MEGETPLSISSPPCQGSREFRSKESVDSHPEYASLIDDAGQRIAKAVSYGDIERRMRFPDAKLDLRVRDGALVITTDKFAQAVTLRGDTNGNAFGWSFEDNHFDLMPGEIKTVRVLGEHSRGRVTAKAWYSAHVTTVDWKR